MDNMLAIVDAFSDFGLIRKEPVLTCGGGLVSHVIFPPFLSSVSPVLPSPSFGLSRCRMFGPTGYRSVSHTRIYRRYGGTSGLLGSNM